MRAPYRPGFHQEKIYKEHITPVRAVLHHASTNCFISLDSLSIKSWRPDALQDKAIQTLHDVSFVSSQPHFVTSICYAASINIIFAACLDNTLKLYNDKFKLKSSMPWSNGVVVDMMYNTHNGDIITAGSYGVKSWSWDPDYEGFRKDNMQDPFEVASDGKAQDPTRAPLPWTFGRHQGVKERLTFRVPGLVPAHVQHISLECTDHSSWCGPIMMTDDPPELFALYQTSVYGFSPHDGSLLHSWRALSEQPVTCLAFIPRTSCVVVGSRAPQAMVWKIGADGQLSPLRSFGVFPGGLLQVVAHPLEGQVMTSSQDGSVMVWSLESYQPWFKMKMSQPAKLVGFYRSDSFYAACHTEVRLFKLLQPYEAFMECNSPVVALQHLSYGLVLATFQDHSVRVLDSLSTCSDKSVMTSVPQLSTANLVAVHCSLTSGKMFSLLSNGHIHVWEMHVKRSPTFEEAWTHFSRDEGVSLSYLDAEAASPVARNQLGVPGPSPSDLLLVGCHTGEVLFCDVRRGGALVLRLPILRGSSVTHIMVDLDHDRLVAAGGCQLKLLGLTTMKCMHDMVLTSRVTCMELLEGRVVVGTNTGRIYVLHLDDGSSVAVGDQGDYEGSVLSVKGSLYLQHFMTCGAGGQVKVFTLDKELMAMVPIGPSLRCGCYLNDEGDLLLALTNKLVTVKASVYATLGKAEGPLRTIYDTTRGTGHVPSTFLRALASPLQNLSEAPVPLDRYFTTSAAAPSAIESSLQTLGAPGPLSGAFCPIGAPAHTGGTTERSCQHQNTLAQTVRSHAATTKNYSGKNRASVAASSMVHISSTFGGLNIRDQRPIRELDQGPHQVLPALATKAQNNPSGRLQLPSGNQGATTATDERKEPSSRAHHGPLSLMASTSCGSASLDVACTPEMSHLSSLSKVSLRTRFTFDLSSSGIGPPLSSTIIKQQTGKEEVLSSSEDEEDEEHQTCTRGSPCPHAHDVNPSSSPSGASGLHVGHLKVAANHQTLAKSHQAPSTKGLEHWMRRAVRVLDGPGATDGLLTEVHQGNKKKKKSKKKARGRKKLCPVYASPQERLAETCTDSHVVMAMREVAAYDMLQMAAERKRAE